MKPEPLLWLSDARGIYIPRDFANSFADRNKSVSGVSVEDWLVLETGPHDNDSYWDAWQEICDGAIITDNNGVKYTVYQDGDCWLIPDGMEWDDETESYQWPDDDAEDC